MGMDVYGKAPTSEVGSYFRNSVWGWHPLWCYVEEIAPALAVKVRYGHSNDCDGLDAGDSKALAAVLRDELKSGRTAEYAAKHAQEMAALPNEPCMICGATGKRLPPPNTGPGEVTCNGCDGKGEREAWARFYTFSVENVQKFAEFLEACGGFEIC